MMTLKRVIALVLVLGLALAVGCGSKPESSSAPEPESVPEPVSSEASKPEVAEDPGNPSVDFEPAGEFGELDDGAKKCAAMFGDPYLELEMKERPFTEVGAHARMTKMYESYAKNDAVEVPTLDWGTGKKQLSGRYTYNYEGSPAQVFAENAESRSMFGFEVTENSQSGDMKFNIRSRVTLTLDRDAYDSDQWKEVVCGYIDDNQKMSSVVLESPLRGIITESWGGGYTSTYTPATKEFPKTTMVSKSNITVFTGGQSAVNIVVGTDGWVESTSEDEDAEAALKEHVANMEAAIWDVFGLGAEAEIVRLAPGLYME